MTKNSEAVVSIVVPVYNTIETIEKCVNSLLSQTYKSLEIILVDDGSTDGSSTLADTMSLSDSRIKVLHKKNGGVTSARHIGWKISRGEYCMFVDSDDTLTCDAVEYLINIIKTNDCDFVSGWYEKVYDMGIVEPIDFPLRVGKFSTEEYIKMSVHLVHDFCSIWIGMFKREMFNEKVFDIDSSFFRGEDATTLIGALNNTKQIYVTDHVFYHYYQNKKSVTHTTDVDLHYIIKLKELQYDIIRSEYKRLYAPILFSVLLYSYFILEKSESCEIKNKIIKLYYSGILDSLSFNDRIRWVALNKPLLKYFLRSFYYLFKVK